MIMNILTAITLTFGIVCFTLAAVVEMRDRQERRRERREAPEVPPAHEAPTVPRDFKPAKPRAVRDRLALAQSRAHAREVHALDQEVHRG